MSVPIRIKSIQKENLFAVSFGICVFIMLILYVYTRHDLMSKRDFKGLLFLMEHEKIMASNITNETLAKAILPSLMVNNVTEYCPSMPPNLRGENQIDLKVESLDVVEKRLSFLLKPGGRFTPKECKPRDRVAIVVPMRGRLQHLPIFLKNLHPMLMRQQIEYAIYVVEQTNDQPLFNKGALFNAGFLESLKMYDWDCFIFHDIDMIPMNDRHLYNCPRNGPLHMGVALDKFNFSIPYDEIYGGVSAFTTEDFKRINGYSNLFWGWGGEDNDLRNRVINAHLPIIRSSEKIARYISLPHNGSDFNSNWIQQVDDGKYYFHTSGLNSLSYHIKEFNIRLSFVHIVIDHIHKEEPQKPPEIPNAKKV